MWLDIDTGMFWGFWERSGKKAQNRQVSIPSEGEGVPQGMEMSRKFHWKFHGNVSEVSLEVSWIFL
jgi:hypothetical protein